MMANADDDAYYLLKNEMIVLYIVEHNFLPRTFFISDILNLHDGLYIFFCMKNDLQ